MSVSAEEGQVVEDRYIDEMVRLQNDFGNSFKIIATIFRDENIWGGLSSEMRKQQRLLASWTLKTLFFMSVSLFVLADKNLSSVGVLFELTF